jgi:hypothetical protein
MATLPTLVISLCFPSFSFFSLIIYFFFSLLSILCPRRFLSRKSLLMSISSSFL